MKLLLAGVAVGFLAGAIEEGEWEHDLARLLTIPDGVLKSSGFEWIAAVVAAIKESSFATSPGVVVSARILGRIAAFKAGSFLGRQAGRRVTAFAMQRFSS